MKIIEFSPKADLDSLYNLIENRYTIKDFRYNDDGNKIMVEVEDGN